jgi:DNA-binding NarL/FixJ family response regulator
MPDNNKVKVVLLRGKSTAMGPHIRHTGKDRPATNGSVWRVLIVDDHPLYRNALWELLQELGLIIVGEAESEDDAIAYVFRTKPDLVTVDLSLAAGSGLSLITKIKRRTSTPHVLVISTYQDRAYADLAIAAGASGYVCKNTDGLELKTALDSIRNGEVYIAPNVVRTMLRTKQASPASQALKERQMSSRELQIFTMIGHGRNTHEIAADLGIAVSTVETYRERLKTKLNLSSGSELMRHAFFWTMQNATSQEPYLPDGTIASPTSGA